MKYKLLGRSGLRVSELCLGTMTFGEDSGYGADRAESERIFHAFREAGGNFFDTANLYGGGRSEEYLGELAKPVRLEVVLATKYTLHDRPGDPNSGGNHRKNLVQSVEGSLRRLRTEYVDLLYVHDWDFMTPVEEVMRALDDLVRAGKVLYLGISNTPAWVVAGANTLAEVRGWTPFVGLQVEYNLLQRTADRDLLPMAEAFDVGVTVWGPLAGGALTGKYLLPQPEIGRLALKPGTPRLNRRSQGIARRVVRIAGRLGCSPAHVALNWLRRRRLIPVFGARTAEQLRENLRCLEVGLSDGDVRSLDRATRIELGFPHDYLRQEAVRRYIFGGTYEAIENHRRREGDP
ncbi:MAG TPA: aldo/keto reductase [Thermoanaerobaculia bacterium]|nr:aldo/keto reductase [Thermoanaerobaculia bacterium]